MAVFYDARGNPIENFAPSKTKKALTGELVAGWNGLDLNPFGRMPSKLNIAFDTSKLVIADYRVMREHPQIANSLAILMFMMYQRDWHITGDRQKEVKFCTENMKMLWGRVPRAMSQALWAGYSPCALNWENDLGDGRMWITKVKDLRPESAKVHWKKVKGVAAKNQGPAHIPYKVPVFDGIEQPGYPDIPIENSFWYPLMIENNDYYGRKLLNSAFQPWYFSMLMHLYANRYMERFAEPTPIGRAPYDDKIRWGEGASAKEVSGNKLMGAMIKMLRNGGEIVLPNNRSTDGINGDSTYDYIIEYLESQLRGVEFDRVIRMYDEEISMALFTPLLLMRSSDTGTGNLGVTQTQTWLTVLNAFGKDWEEFLNKYLIRPMALQNFGPNARIPVLEFRPLGKMDAETMRAIIQAKLAKNWDVDLEEIGALAGLTFKEVEEILPPPQDNPLLPDGTPNNPDGSKKDPRVGRPGKNVTPKGTDKVLDKVAARIRDQATRAHTHGTWKDWEPDLGFRAQITARLQEKGIDAYDAEDRYREMCDAVTALERGPQDDRAAPARFADVAEGVLGAMLEVAA